MGVDYYASAIVGVAFDAKVFEETVKETVPSCKHPERVGNKFCPVCGERVGNRTTETPRYSVEDIVDALPDGYEEFSREHLGMVVIGVGPDHADDSRPVKTAKVPDREEVEKTLKAVLEPMGLWGKARFGLHAVLECSY